MRREVQIMHHLAGHPNVTLLKGAYEDRHHVHLVRLAQTAHPSNTRHISDCKLVRL